jgi:hypothetical protein
MTTAGVAGTRGSRDGTDASSPRRLGAVSIRWLPGRERRDATVQRPQPVWLSSKAFGRVLMAGVCSLCSWPRCRDGFDIVFARRRVRRFGRWKNVTARIYYAVFRWLADVQHDPRIGSYSIVSRKVVEAFLQFGDYRRGYVVVLQWLGFSRSCVDVEHRERADGRSSYSAWRLLGLALTIALTYSEKPLHLSIYVGGILSLLSFVFGLWLIVRYYTSNVGQMALGWTSLIISHLFLSGLILIGLGVIGLHIGRVFEQVKHRPIYVVREARNVSAARESTGSPRPSAWA